MNPMVTTDEFVSLYLSECGQMVQKFEKLILESDQKGELTDPSELFRLLHTLKGTSAMMGYHGIVDISHTFENIFSTIRKSGESVRGERLQTIIDAALEYITYFRIQMNRVRGSASPEPDARLSTVMEKIAALFVESVTPILPAEPSAPIKMPLLIEGGNRVLVRLKSCSMPHIRASVITKSVLEMCISLQTIPGDLDTAGKLADSIRNDGFVIQFIAQPNISAEDIVNQLLKQPFVASCRIQTDEPPVSPIEQLKTVTVEQPVVTRLIALMSEIAAAENAVEVCAGSADCDRRQMQRLLSALRQTVAEARVLTAQIGLQNVGGVFMQMQRAVRSMAKELHKDIRVVTEGTEVQVDKSVLEILSDSLIHVIRNAAVHGIEAPEERIARGKPAAGQITLRAIKKNHYLTVTVADDGAGIRRQEVLDSAEKHGKLVKPGEQYTDQELWELLLFSGVSTSTGVTQYSGRGIGLDTTVRRIRQAGGMVSVESKENAGTTFTLKIPVTLLTVEGIEAVLPDGNEIIIPANAVHRVLRSDFAPETYSFDGSNYSRICFPGQRSGDAAGEEYLVLLEKDFGPYYIRTKMVRMLSVYFVKEMPEFVSDAMGRGYIYAGCVLCQDQLLRCVLDVAKLIDVWKTKLYPEKGDFRVSGSDNE